MWRSPLQLQGSVDFAFRGEDTVTIWIRTRIILCTCLALCSLRNQLSTNPRHWSRILPSPTHHVQTHVASHCLVLCSSPRPLTIGSVSVRFGPMCRTDNFGDGVGPDRLKNELGPNWTDTDPKTAKTDRSVWSMDDNWTGLDRYTYYLGRDMRCSLRLSLKRHKQSSVMLHHKMRWNLRITQMM